MSTTGLEDWSRLGNRILTRGMVDRHAFKTIWSSQNKRVVNGALMTPDGTLLTADGTGYTVDARRYRYTVDARRDTVPACSCNGDILLSDRTYRHFRVTTSCCLKQGQCFRNILWLIIIIMFHNDNPVVESSLSTKCSFSCTSGLYFVRFLFEMFNDIAI